MTNEIIFKTRVDTGTTSKDLAAISTELGKIDEGTKTVGKDSAAQLEALNAKIKAGGMTARELSRAVNEYMTIARDAGRTSPVGQQAIAEAAILTDELADLRNEIKRNAHDGANMQAALQLGGTLVAGYGVAQGAMAMMGVENEKLMQSMVKLQAATSVLTGLEQIRVALEKESELMIKAKALQTKVLTGATAAYSVAVGTSTGALKLFRLALIATGIGAIIVGIGLLIANFDKVKAAVQAATDRFNSLGDGVKLALSIIFPFIGAIRLVTGALEKLGIIQGDAATEAEKSAERQRVAYAQMVADQRKETDKKIKDNEAQQDSIESTYDFEIAKAKAAGKDTSDLERQKREEMRKSYVEQLKNLEMSARLNVGNAQEMKKILDQVSEYRKNILKIDQEEELATITQTTTARKKGADAAKEAEKQRVDAAAKELERERLLRDYFIASIADDDVRASLEMQERHKRELEDLKAKYGADAEMENALRKQQNLERAKLENEWIDAQTQIRTDDQIKEAEATRRNEMAALELKLIALEKEGQDTYAVRQQILEAEMLQALENTELTENEKLLIKAKYNQQLQEMNKEAVDKELEAQRQATEQTVKIIEQGMNAIGSISDAVFANKLANVEKGSKEELEIQKKQFKANKAMQLSASVIDGFKAITASLAQSPVAIGAVPNPAGIASLAFAAATSAANIAKIAATRFDGGAITPPDVNTPQIGAPEIPQAPNAQTTQTAGLVGGNKVVVVDSEIKAVMDSSQQIQVVSSFG